MNINESLPANVFNMDDAEQRLQSFRILIVIPTLGTRIETLRRTLTSIQQQDGVRVDVVIVSKTRTPELTAIAANFQANIFIHQGHISEALNVGFAEARKEHRYASWLGDDDMLRPGALANASTFLEQNPKAVAYYGSCDYVDIRGTLLFSRRPPPKAPALLQFVPGLIKQEACLFRISALVEAGGLDERLKYTMDLDLLLRLRRLGPFVKSDHVHAAFCWHSGSLTIANRMDSFNEAQSVQDKHARGIIRMLYRLLRYPILYFILAISWKINRDLINASVRAKEDAKLAFLIEP